MSDADVTPEFTSEMAITLHREMVTNASEAASLRGEVGTRIKSFTQTHNLDAKAFKMASTIRKMENGKREHFIRNLQKYMDLLCCNQQKDIFDTIADNNAGKVRSDLEAELDGQPRTAAADNTGEAIEDSGRGARVNAAYTPRSAMGKHTLNAFRATVEEAVDREALNTGLEKFCADHPKLADEGRTIVTDRLRRLGEEQGGGEDLRSTAARQGEADAAEQAAETGKRTGRGKARTDDQPSSVH